MITYAHKDKCLQGDEMSSIKDKALLASREALEAFVKGSRIGNSRDDDGLLDWPSDIRNLRSRCVVAEEAIKQINAALNSETACKTK